MTLQPTDDGNYLLLSYRLRSGVDASAYNGDADATVYRRGGSESVA